MATVSDRVPKEGDVPKQKDDVPSVPPQDWIADMPMNYEAIDQVGELEDLSEEERAEAEAYFAERGVDE